MANSVTNWWDLKTLLSEISFRYENPECFQLNSVQCKHLCDALVSLSAILLDFVDKYSNAGKEIYRAVKEVEIYLQHCSRSDWPIKFLTRSTTGEAYSLHLHDLDFCRLLLHVIYTTKIRRIMNRHEQQMGRFTKTQREYVDEMQLIKICEQFAERSTHTTEEKNIVEVSKFLGEKLKGTVPIPASTEVESAGAENPIPTWLQIDPADLVLGETIGEGSFGHVYEASWLGLRVAAKEMPMDALDVFELEASILAKLHSPFIVHLIGTCIKDSHLYLVMELVSSNLEQLLAARSKRKRSPLSLPVAVDIMLQISRAMEYLHSQGIMHLDLKPSNVLFELSSDPESREAGYGRVKLCDFGMASTRLFSFRASDPKGTSYWRAPEIFPPRSYQDMSPETNRPEVYTNKADVYSFGMTCYEILTGKQPFAGVLPAELYTKIVRGERPTLKPSICPFILANYIQQCWRTDPDHRPCFEAVSNFLRKLKLCILSSPYDWKEALDRRFYPDLGFVDGEEESIFNRKLKTWKHANLVEMHNRLDEMLFRWRFLTLEMRRGIAIDIASFLARIHGNSDKAISHSSLHSSAIYLDGKLKPIFSGALSGSEVIRLGQIKGKRFPEFMKIQAFGKILVELSTGCTWEDMSYSIASIQSRNSGLEFVDKQLVEEMGRKGERQLWEVVRWCKLGLWCLSDSPSKQPEIHTVLQLLKEGPPIDLPWDPTLRNYFSSIPTIENSHPFSSTKAVLMYARESFVRRMYCSSGSFVRRMYSSSFRLMSFQSSSCEAWDISGGGSGESEDDSDGVSEEGEDVSDGISENGIGLQTLFG